MRICKCLHGDKLLSNAGTNVWVGDVSLVSVYLPPQARVQGNKAGRGDLEILFSPPGRLILLLVCRRASLSACSECFESHANFHSCARAFAWRSIFSCAAVRLHHGRSDGTVGSATRPLSFPMGAPSPPLEVASNQPRKNKMITRHSGWPTNYSEIE